MSRSDHPEGKTSGSPAASDLYINARLALGIKDRALAESYASVLRGLGFEVDSVSARGVDFRGLEGLLARVFDSPLIHSEGGWRFATEPKLPQDFRTHVESVYVPSRPQYFSSRNR